MPGQPAEPRPHLSQLDSPYGAFQLDPRQQHGKGDVVLMQHASSHPVKCHLGTKKGTLVLWSSTSVSLYQTDACSALYLEEVLGYDGEALRVVSGSLQVRVLIQHIVVDIEEELQ